LIKNTHSSWAEGGGGSRRKAPSDQQPRVFCPLRIHGVSLSLVSWGSCMSHTPASSTGGSVPLLSEPSVRPGPSLSLSIQENDRMIVPFRSVAAHSRIYRSVDFWRGTRTQLAEHAGCRTEHIHVRRRARRRDRDRRPPTGRPLSRSRRRATPEERRRQD
jgi:hypothetical protein